MPQFSGKEPLITRPRWWFASPAPVQRQRNSKLDEHFAGSGSDRAGDLVREGAQNAGDAHGGDGPVRIRIGFGELPASQAEFYVAGLAEHLHEIGKLKGMEAVKMIAANRPVRFMTFEDFGTTGLTGSPEVDRRYDGDPPNAFHTFFRAEGQTDKVDDRKQGSKGVGKITFMAASLARAVFGLTCRQDDDRTLLFGTAVLRTHRIAGEHYDGDAWFGFEVNKRVQPIEDAETITRFTEDFQLARQPGQYGFSIVIPWLNNDEEDGVTPTRVIQAVLRDHAWPIFHNKLVIEVVDVDGTVTTIDSSHFLGILDSQPDQFKHSLRPMAELAAWSIANPPLNASDHLGLHKQTAPSWSDPDLVSEVQRDNLQGALRVEDAIAVRVPIRIRPKQRGLPEKHSHFDVFLRRDPSALGATVQFIRGGLLISGMSRRLPGLRALVVAEDAGLAGFLRAAENPSHTKWNAKAIKDTYTYAPGTLSFVIDAVKHLAAILADDQNEKDGTIWAGELSLPAGLDSVSGAGAGSVAKAKRRKPKRPEVIDPLPKLPKKRPYEINVISGGFAVQPSGRPFLKGLPAELEISLAYHVRGKNPLGNYSSEDFDLTEEAEFPSSVTGCVVTAREPNRLVMRIDSLDFRFQATGFDIRRELFCRPRLRYLNDQADEDPDDDPQDDDEVVASDLIAAGNGEMP